MNEASSPLEDVFGDPEAFAQAQADAANGELQHTLLQNWLFTLGGHMEGSQRVLTLFSAQTILQRWPFLEHSDLPLYMQDRVRRIGQAIDIINDVIEESPKSREALFLENKMDFRLHKDMYREIIARFTELVEFWQDDWTTISFEFRTKAIAHAATADIMDMLLGQYGLIIELRSLKEYGWTDEDDQAIKDRLEELRADREATAREMDNIERAVNEAADEAETDE